MTTTNLSNANLLDDGLANSKSLKNQRLNQTAEKAVNPNPKRVEKTYNAKSTKDTEEFEFPANKPDFAFAKNNAERKSDSNSESKKILGMNPVLFYTILGAAVIGGGYLLYNYLKKNKKLANLDSAKALAPVNANVEIPDLPPLKA